MGSILKKTVTRPLPKNATIIERRRRATESELRRNPGQSTVVENVATWKDRCGKKQTGVVAAGNDGLQRVRVQGETYFAKYRDGNGIVRVVATGCRDKQAAMTKLAALKSTADKVRVGSLTTQDLEIGLHCRTPIGDHLTAYWQSKRVGGVTERHITETKRNVESLLSECEIKTLRDITAEGIESWLAKKQAAKMGSRTRNVYLQGVRGFCKWAVESGRLNANPLTRLKLAKESTDRKRQRRALSEAELHRLLFVARWRPLAEFGRTTEAKTGDDLPDDPKSRKTWTLQSLSFDSIPEAVERAKTKLADNPAFLDELDRRGRERELIYKFAVLTGLRRGEIESLTVEHLHLSESLPLIRMRPQDTKNREAVEIPLREDLADDLRQWLESKRGAVAGVVAFEVHNRGVKPTERLFDVPRQLVKTLDRDLAAAGIAKTDDRGRTVDVHALRHTFGTLLSKGGVSPRTAQQAMRHSKIDLTMNVYTDPRLLDVAGAVDLLPALPLSVSPIVPSLERQRATGTDDRRSLVAPTVAPAAVNSCNFESFSDNKSSERDDHRKRKNPATTGVIAGFSLVETRGVEPLTPCLQSRNDTPEKCPKMRDETQDAKFGCTNGCTCERCLMQLANDLRQWLNAEELARLVILLT